MVGETCVAGCQRGDPGTGPGELSEPRGIDANLVTGRLYIADEDNERVQRWNAVRSPTRASSAPRAPATASSTISAG